MFSRAEEPRGSTISEPLREQCSLRSKFSQNDWRPRGWQNIIFQTQYDAVRHVVVVEEQFI